MTLGGGPAQSGSTTPGSSSSPPASSVIPPIPVLRPVAAGASPFDSPLPSHHRHFTMSHKYSCTCMPCQSGKTRNMQELMLDYNAMSKTFYPDDENYINVVICSRNLNLVQQTEARHKKDLFSPSSTSEDDSDSGSADDKIDGEVFSWMSGTKDTNITPEALGMKIAMGDVRMVICCAHKKRLQYLADLLALFDRAVFFKHRVNIWMDEADDYVNLWSDIDFARFNKVNHIHLVTATLDAIVDKFKRIKVRPMPVTFPPCYHRTCDSRIVEVDVAIRNPVDYLKAVYAIYKDSLCVPGVRVFAPGDLTVKSHDEIANFLLSEGFAVCVLNGSKKCIYVPGVDTPLNILDHVQSGEIMEVGLVIARMYQKYHIGQFPFAITGKICLGRGITFNCEEFFTYLSMADDGTVSPKRDLDFDFLFDASVIPPMTDRATLYQCASRTKGNYKKFKNYKSPIEYMTSETHQMILDAEAIAMNLPVLVHLHKLADVGEEEMKWAIHGDEERYRKDVEASLRAKSPQKNDDWEVPIKVALPLSLLDSDNFRLAMSKTRRPLLTQAILELLKPEERSLLGDRTLWHKRNTIGPIRRIQTAYNDGRGSAPGGGTITDVDLSKHFWLDYVSEDQKDMSRGTAFITYHK